MTRREAIARHRLREMIDATPAAKRPTMRAKIAASMGFKGTKRSRSDAVGKLLRGERAMTGARVTRIYDWFGRRARGEVRGVEVRKIAAKDYQVLGTMERMVLTPYAVSHIDADEFMQRRTIWTMPAPPIVIDTVAHIRSFAFAIIERAGYFYIGGSFTIPWGEMSVRAIGRDIVALFRKFNGAIYEAFTMRPPGEGYRIVALAFTEEGAAILAEEYDVAVDSYGYGVFLESRRVKRGEPYRLKEVSL